MRSDGLVDAYEALRLALRPHRLNSSLRPHTLVAEGLIH
jgi:hypothetical protein